MSLVVDSSITLAWYFEDEATRSSDGVLELVTRHGAVAPPIWPFEVANGLQMAVKRKRIDIAYRDRVLARLAGLAISIDPESQEHAWSATVHLSQRHRLTVYDAAYLELAQRRRLELGTLDLALARAASTEGVSVIGR